MSFVNPSWRKSSELLKPFDMESLVFGIDYGSKLTGNTVIAVFDEGSIYFLDMKRGIDADLFILNAAEYYHPSKIFIDAPLSLPGVYSRLQGFKDYHFRRADKELKAMSPMFLGGLAARAIELKTKLERMGIEVFETYPKIIAHRLNLTDCDYKGSIKSLHECSEKVLYKLPDSIQIDNKDIMSWHHLDALLALISAINSLHGKSEVFGHQKRD